MTELFVVAIIVLSLQGFLGNQATKRLYEDITKRTNDCRLRPRENGSRRMTLHLGLRLSQILDVDEKNQIITTNVWLLHEWTDTSLSWDPEIYSGVDRIYIPSENIWLPDVVLYNNANGNYEVTIMTKATLFSTGKVRWEPPVIYKSFCPIDVEFYPFDIQHCSFKFGSWTYDGFQIDLKPLFHQYRSYHHPRSNKEINDEADVYNDAIDLREFYPSVEWDLIGVPAKWNEKYYPCCSEPYLDITFNITIRRKTLFHTVNLIIPCVAITFLTVLVFYLPSESGEKISLSVSILLSLTVFFLLLAEIIPPTSIVIPLIVKYLLFTMILVTMSIVGTVSVLNIHFRSSSTHTMSPWMKKVFLDILPRFLGLMRPQPPVETKKYSPSLGCNRNYVSESQAVIKPKSILKKSKSISPCKSPIASDPHLQWKIPRPKIAGSSTFSNKGLTKSNSNQIVSQATTSTDNARVKWIPQSTTPSRKFLNIFDRRTGDTVVDMESCSNLKEFRVRVEYVCEHMQKEDQDVMIKEEWKFVARVLDRLFLLIFTTACLVGTVGIIFQAPTMYDDTVPMTNNETMI